MDSSSSLFLQKQILFFLSLFLRITNGHYNLVLYKNNTPFHEKIIETFKKIRLSTLKKILFLFKEHLKYTREEEEKERDNKKKREKDREKYEKEQDIRKKEVLENKDKLEKVVKQKSLKIKLLEKF